MKDKINIIIPLSLIILYLIYKPALIFLTPGIAILFLPSKKKEQIYLLIVLIIFSSLSFWIISFWWLNFFKITYTTFFNISFISLIFFLLYISKTDYKSITVEIDKEAFVVLGVFLLSTLLRLYPVLYQYSPGGNDMSMHTYMAKLIHKANGIPKDYSPILPFIPSFTSNSAGMPALIALYSLLADIPLYSSALYIALLTHAFFLLALFYFLRGFFSAYISIITSIIMSFALENPNEIIEWGGNPTLLAFGLMILSYAFADRFFKEWKISLAIPIALFSASAFLVHSIPVLGFVYILFIVCGYKILMHKVPNDFKFNMPILKKPINPKPIFILLTLTLSAVFISPYLLNFNTPLSDHDLRLILEWQRYQNHSWKGTVYDAWYSIPLYIKFFAYKSGDRHLFLLIGILWFFYKRRYLKETLDMLLIFLTICLMILNSNYWVLPGSFLLYPDRIVLLCTLPFSFLFAGFCEFSDNLLHSLKERFCKKEHFITFAYIYIFAVIILIISNSIKPLKKFYAKSAFASTLTKADINAIGWLDNYLGDRDEVISVNYGDAGVWLPSMILRPIVGLHVHIVFLEEYDAWMKKQKHDIIYIGKKSWMEQTLKKIFFTAKSDYKLIYDNDGVSIFEGVQK